MNYHVTSENELREQFWADLREFRPSLYDRRKPGSQNDQPTDIRLAWVDFVDAMERAGAIPEELADEATL